MNQPKMNLLVTLDSGYLHPLAVMLKSAVLANPGTHFDVYVLHRSLKDSDFERIFRAVGDGVSLFPILVDTSTLKNAPTSRRYPTEIYFRLLAPLYLPKTLDRILYLDPDLVIINPLPEFYEMSLENHLFAACSHVLFRGLQKINEWRLDMEKGTPYINSGVLLMNLESLRRELDPETIYSYIRDHRKRLMLPDQDVLSALFGPKTLLLDSLKYNLSEKYQAAFNLRSFPGESQITLDWIRKNTVIVHYCGRNKPWKENYLGILDCFYREIADQVRF